MSTKIVSAFINGVTFGFKRGLMPIAFAIGLGMFFVCLSIAFGGGTKTYWEIVGLLLSIPWSFLMTGTDGTTTPWMMLGGMLINLLVISAISGVANLLLSLFRNEDGDKSNKC